MKINLILFVILTFLISCDSFAPKPIFCHIEEYRFSQDDDEINISLHGIVELPPCIGDFNFLKILDASYNPLTTLPDEIGNLPKLKELYLHNCWITHLPESISKLKNILTILNLSNNNISSEEKEKIINLLPNTNIIWD